MHTLLSWCLKVARNLGKKTVSFLGLWTLTGTSVSEREWPKERETEMGCKRRLELTSLGIRIESGFFSQHSTRSCPSPLFNHIAHPLLNFPIFRPFYLFIHSFMWITLLSPYAFSPSLFLLPLFRIFLFLKPFRVKFNHTFRKIRPIIKRSVNFYLFFN